MAVLPTLWDSARAIRACPMVLLLLQVPMDPGADVGAGVARGRRRARGRAPTALLDASASMRPLAASGLQRCAPGPLPSPPRPQRGTHTAGAAVQSEVEVPLVEAGIAPAGFVDSFALNMYHDGSEGIQVRALQLM